MATPTFNDANQQAAYRQGFRRGRSERNANKKQSLTRGDLAKIRSQKTPRETRAYILGVRDGAKRRRQDSPSRGGGKGARGGSASGSG